jgi:hypothetical protein
MPNLYFIQSGNNSGMLRAVLSQDEGRDLLTRHAADYVGKTFPKSTAEAHCALLRIFETEGDKSCRAGFYRFAADIMEIESPGGNCEPVRTTRLGGSVAGPR